MPRTLIVVDVETTGLDTVNDHILEVAAINTETGAEFRFVPHIDEDVLGNANPYALSINRYYERRVFDDELNRAETNAAFRNLRELLDGNTLGGSNPRFDAAMLARHIGEPWHHRLADLSAYAAGALGIEPDEMPGLDEVCELLGVTNDEPHSALGDARATAHCFTELAARATKGKPMTHYPIETLDPDYDDGRMPDNVDELRKAVVGHRIVSAAEQEVKAAEFTDGHVYGSPTCRGFVLTLDNGHRVLLEDTSDCCAFTQLESFLLHPERVDHIITGIGTTEQYEKWHIFADLGDVLELEVGWSAGNPFYYGYGFDIAVSNVIDADPELRELN